MEVCKFLIRNPIRYHFLKVSKSLQLLLKWDFVKFLEKLELQNAEVSITLLKSDSTTDALPAFLKIFRTKETPAVESVFGIVIGEWIGQLEFCKRNATKEVF